MTLDEKKAVARKRLADRIGMPPEFSIGLTEEGQCAFLKAQSDMMIFGTGEFFMSPDYLTMKRLPSFADFVRRTS